MAQKVILQNLLTITKEALSTAEALCATAKEKLCVKVSDNGKISNDLIEKHQTLR